MDIWIIGETEVEQSEKKKTQDWNADISLIRCTKECFECHSISRHCALYIRYARSAGVQSDNTWTTGEKSKINNASIAYTNFPLTCGANNQRSLAKRHERTNAFSSTRRYVSLQSDRPFGNYEGNANGFILNTFI